jgi:hypothetical protein
MKGSDSTKPLGHVVAAVYRSWAFPLSNSSLMVVCPIGTTEDPEQHTGSGHLQKRKRKVCEMDSSTLLVHNPHPRLIEQELGFGV